MKQGGDQTVDVRTRLNAAAKKFRRRVTHGAHRGHALLFPLYPARDPKVDQHYPAAVAIDHQVCRFEIAIDDGLGPAVKILKDVCCLHPPIGDRLFVNSSTWCGAQPRGQIAAGNKLHYQIETTERFIVKVIVDGGYGWMFERRQQQRLALEISNSFLVLSRIEVGLDHFLYRARRVAQSTILC